ncbi:MAG: GrpB family protein [Sphingomonas sp.]|nr:GrpB family protein [Sphingomonas sp.]
MLPPYPVRLVRHEPGWARIADEESDRLLGAAEGAILEVHHIGSTSIPGILAKPIVDLMGIAPSLDELERARGRIEVLGYAWHGEFGLQGRRFCTLSDPVAGQRRFHLHCYAIGDHSIRRHLAFRDYLRSNAEVARAYERMDAVEVATYEPRSSAEVARAYELIKNECAARHPEDSHRYTKCKNGWISRVERQALRHYRPQDRESR